MAAKSKSELQDITQKEFLKLTKIIDPIAPDTAVRKREEQTSIKDVVAHRAHWIDLFLGWYRDGLEGKEVHFPAKGYKWNDLKRYNADLRAKQADMTWDQAKSSLADCYARLEAFIADHTDKELYGAPMAGAKNAWTPGRWAEAAGPSHFRSAAKFIRSALKSDSAT